MQLGLLMMSDIPLETCWVFKELWNNKFRYQVASCWLLLLSHTTMHGSMNIKFPYFLTTLGEIRYSGSSQACIKRSWTSRISGESVPKYTEGCKWDLASVFCIFIPTEIEGEQEAARKKLLDICAFCANWRSESENLLEGVNFYSYFPHLLSNLGEIRYKWSVGNVGGWVRVQWKLVHGRLHLSHERLHLSYERLHLSYERKWNATEACVVNPTTFESKEHLGKLCKYR